MRQLRRRYGFVLAGLVLVLAAGFGLTALRFSSPARQALASWRDRGHNLPLVAARRANVQVMLTAGGTIDSANRTLIECELEAITFSSNTGGSMSTRGASRILSLIPEGSDVQKGDLLCELDASDYQELVRQQTLKVEEAKADQRGAELRMQTSMAALSEFREGLKGQGEQTLRSSVALAESNVQSAMERQAFTQKMFQFGYAASAKLTADRLATLRAEEALREARLALQTYDRYEVPKRDLALQAAVDTARADLSYQSLRLSRHLDRLKVYQKQVDLCTIRAPHDGFVIYATEDDSNVKIEPGTTVRTKQDLFYLPDMDHMRVHALIHESQVDEVAVGMKTRVVVEGMAEHELTGRIVWIDQLPFRNRDWKASPDVKYFLVKVDLDESPMGLRPGMTANVEVAAGRREAALVVPIEAIAHEDGEDVVYVYMAGRDRIERRIVATTPATVDLVCIDSGLNEGDEVVLDPERHHDHLPGADREENTIVAH